MLKVYLTLALTVFAFGSGWKVHSWYEGNKEKDVIVKEVEFFNEQTLKDGDRLLIAQIELDDYKNQVKELEAKAYAINKGICVSDNSHAAFISVYNQAIKRANSQGP